MTAGVILQYNLLFQLLIRIYSVISESGAICCKLMKTDKTCHISELKTRVNLAHDLLTIL
jgi:hypothetical protein